MGELSIKFDNNVELEIESITENHNVILKKRNLFMRIPLKQEDSAKIENIITAENMKHFKVLRDAEQIDEFTGYDDIVSIDKMINKSEQYINVNSTKNNKNEG